MSQLSTPVCGRLPFMRFTTCILGAAVSLSLLTRQTAQGQDAYIPQAGEYLVSGLLFGDQVRVAVDVQPSGGILAWQDSYTDGDGSGISARLLDSTLSGSLSSFRVNDSGTGDQAKPDVAMLGNGGAVVVWEGAGNGFQDVYARFLSESNTWVGGDITVNTHTADLQDDPCVIALDTGEAVVAWSSVNQVSATSMKDVYFQRFSPSGQKLGGAVRVNQVSSLNQRSPAMAKLSDGRFVVCWVSESVQAAGSDNESYAVDLYARFYAASGVAQGGEFKVNTTPNVCANPSLAASADGGFLVAWSQKDLTSLDNSWDVAARTVSSTGVRGSEVLLNTHRYGDQFGPKAAALGSDYLVVWTSLAQDGSHEGVFGRYLAPNGSAAGDEFQVNTTSVSKQVLPDLASDGGTRFLAVWSSFTGVAGGFDVFGQRYASVLDPLPPLDAPNVWPVGFTELALAWSELAGFDLDAYEVLFDGQSDPVLVTPDHWGSVTNLTPDQSYTFRVRYKLADGRLSPLSDPATARTYGAFGTLYYDADVPFDWMVEHWGLVFTAWPGIHADSDGDGASNYHEFLAGTDPRDPASVLRTSLVSTTQGFYLNWNTEPGRIYQVQKSANFTTWTQVGGYRFAPGAADSVYVGGESTGLFRVVVLHK